MIAFGPIPSRRLGRSLGINHIPLKVCSYACVYCQVGPTLQMRAERQAFHSPAEIVDSVSRKVAECHAKGESIDYLSFVPDGEPTLDVNLGAHIRALEPLGIPVAVITNASLLWMPEVREELAAAGLVSVKVDTTLPGTWHRLDRPHGGVDLAQVLDGIRTFAREYRGTLISDTLLVRGINDDADTVTCVADFLAEIQPARAYLGVATRPPVERDVRPPQKAALVRAYEIMRARVPQVELLSMHEEGAFTQTGDAVEGLLSILAVHPMREEAVQAYLRDAGTDVSLLEPLIQEGRVDRVVYQGATFYVRSVARAAGANRNP
jgi:wyosine [tRNA(Phe)-imidazoG37] synthetase (radical SAM superfamily)